ncbi:MAG: hypothetical protein U0230_00885 [Polyangiales bacterium]
MLPCIELAPDAGKNAFAEMLAQLLRQNLDDHPDKQQVFVRLHATVAIVVEDLDLAVTLEFRRGRLVVHDGIVGVPDLAIRAPSEWVMKMSLVELRGRFGLPDPNGQVAREVWGASTDGTIRVLGALTSFPLALRLTRVMSVN